MIENRLTLISAIIIVVIVGGAVLIKLNREEPVPLASDAHTIDIASIPAEQLVTEELYSEILREGSGEAAEVGDTVSMNYVGVLTDGTQFDSSYDRGEPFQFTIGEGGVIDGWELGVPGMKVGEQKRLIIPADLGYGDRDRGNIPANSTLVFDVELVEIIPAE